MNPLLNKCPVCSAEMVVTRLYCPQCDTTIEGHFQPAPNPLAALNPEQIQFLFSFIRCEGRFNRLEDELGLSYPTLRNRFNEILRALGFEPGREDTPARLSGDDRRQILLDLENGRITASEAQNLLKGSKQDTP
jgi:hypothetical protein